MSGPTRSEIERALDRLEGGDGEGRGRRRPVPPAQARRMQRAFEEFGADDPERTAHMFTYGPSGEDVEFTDTEAAAVRTIVWREEFGEEPPWSDDADGGRGTGNR